MGIAAAEKRRLVVKGLIVGQVPARMDPCL